MELPRLLTIHGAYVYFMVVLSLVVIVLGGYFVAVYFGLVPPPETFIFASG